MIGFYLNEKVTITDESKDTCTIKYEDGYEESVPKNKVTVFKTKYSYVRRINPKRRKKKFKEHFHSEERVKFINKLGCLICKKPAQNAHIKSRAAGGTYRDIVPLCNDHHREQERSNQKFGKKYRLNLREEANKVNKLTGNLE